MYENSVGFTHNLKIFFLLVPAFLTLFSAIYFPVHKVVAVTLPICAASLVIYDTSYLKLAIILLIVWIPTLHSFKIDSFAHGTMKKPMWTKVFQFFSAVIIVLVFGAKTFEDFRQKTVSSQEMAYIFILMLALPAFYFIVSAYLFYVIAPFAKKRKVSRKGRLLAYRVMSRKALNRKKRMSYNAKFVTGANYKHKCFEVAKSVPLQRKNQKSCGILHLFPKAIVFRIVSDKELYITRVSGFQEIYKTTNSIYTYEKVTSGFGLVYITKFKKEKNNSPTESPWDRKNKPSKTCFFKPLPSIFCLTVFFAIATYAILIAAFNI